MTAIKRTDSGFSIIEVLVAIIILSVGLLALAQSSGTVSRMVGRGNQQDACGFRGKNGNQSPS
jgi:prepilin-type N-terminal cleavage/methylation domain-containing protein